ncbi:MAG: MgtC/SapB family protein [Chloroflexus sp.]|jgi:putative Mg2+ transporter-C (MgtC) family protein|uniref:MgtC/SapB family protein n=1 Tax=Chloroflexus sp. MS-G TaxID=1521187 RepID=UPI0004DF073F|nr:MgtC/SapB family protein [Chloroflexus sp. MS-G]MBO9313508.1 MgtC/SapB family protein [Chloroflexus sp.]MBO9316745.1 MgtC/SapB family protein [Chloroflexus sp.]MBO9318310.1 MgtC/SapB family protein [Chloroflexus sp.]MBO9339561.1 MgtC/SapB family protein [Chloroflexus sp.]MBO9374814.1 MgtC/SapB family protein [Chloroflexus sp.]
MQDVVIELVRLLGPANFDLIFRLILTMILCGLIGLERSNHERASGFRPHILVGLGACMVTMAGAYGFPELTGERDALRVASYVVSGIGFLGAGAILRHGTTVRGLTTAATLWGCAGIGVTVATGLGWLAIVSTVLFLFTLMILEWLEAKLNFGRPVSRLRIHLHDDNRAVGKALNALARLGAPVKRATVLPGAGTSALLDVELARALTAEQAPLLAKQLLTLKKYVAQVDTTVAPLDEPADDEEPAEMRDKVVPLNLSDDDILRDLNDQDEKEKMSSPRA